jgi:hypothetical protein
MDEISTGRKFERVVANVLPCRATSARSAVHFDPTHSDPFVVGEFVVARDAPDTPFYIAKIAAALDLGINVHYFGCIHVMIDRAVFKPCWHLPGSNDIELASDPPSNAHLRHSGQMAFDSLRNLLVARNLEFTTSRKLRKKSQRLIAPLHDELFIFDK